MDLPISSFHFVAEGEEDLNNGEDMLLTLAFETDIIALSEKQK